MAAGRDDDRGNPSELPERFLSERQRVDQDGSLCTGKRVRGAEKAVDPVVRHAPLPDPWEDLIDVIGNWITEINVTSPTGLQEINRFDQVMLEDRIWDAIEKRLGRK
jgi:hypothetical protein